MDASGGAAAPSGQVVPAGAEDAGGDAAVGEASDGARGGKVIHQRKRKKRTVSAQPTQSLTSEDGPAEEATGLRKSTRTRKANSRIHGAEWK